MKIDQKFICSKVLVILSYLFLVSCFVLTIVSYALPYWFTIRAITAFNDNTRDWINLDRTLGIFQECVQDRSFKNLKATLRIVNEDGCAQNDFTQLNITAGLIPKFFLGQVILHGISLLFLLFNVFISVGFLLLWFCQYQEDYVYIKARIVVGVFSLLTFLCLATSSSLGTAILIISKETVNLIPKWEVSYMFLCSWIGTGFAFLATICMFISVCVSNTIQSEKYRPHIVQLDNPSFEKDAQSHPVFLSPTSNVSNSVTPNNSINPSLLPRYNI